MGQQERQVKGWRQKKERKMQERQAKARQDKFARKEKFKNAPKPINHAPFSSSSAAGPAVTRPAQSDSSIDFDSIRLVTVKNAKVNDGTPYLVRFSDLNPQAQGITDPEEQLKWYEETKILMRAQIDENGIRNARVGHNEVKGPEAGRWAKPTQDNGLKAAVAGRRVWIEGQHCYPRQIDQRTGEHVNRTVTMNMNVEAVYDRPGENGYYPLEAGSEGKGGGQRIYAFANWVSVGKVKQREYAALAKYVRLHPKIDYSKGDTHENLLAVATRLQNDATFMANYANEKALTASSMTSHPAQVPSLSEIASAVSELENLQVGEKVVEGPSIAGTVSGMGVLP